MRRLLLAALAAIAMSAPARADGTSFLAPFPTRATPYEAPPDYRRTVLELAAPMVAAGIEQRRDGQAPTLAVGGIAMRDLPPAEPPFRRCEGPGAITVVGHRFHFAETPRFGWPRGKAEVLLEKAGCDVLATATFQFGFEARKDAKGRETGDRGFVVKDYALAVTMITAAQ